MSVLVIVHIIGAVALVAISLAVAAWGLSRRTKIGPREAYLFGHSVQLSHTLVIATGFIGLLLLGEGQAPQDPLHARVYGPFMVVAIVAAYAYRTKDARNNVTLHATVALIIAALGARAIVTGA